MRRSSGFGGCWSVLALPWVVVCVPVLGLVVLEAVGRCGCGLVVSLLDFG